MKNMYKALASAAIVLLAASCVNEMGNDTADGLFRKYNLSFEGSTKTELSGTGSTRQVNWTDGDEIKYYTVDKQPNASTASVSVDGSSAFVEIPRGRNDDFINAVYGAGSLTASSSTSDCMYVASPAKSDQSYTTFAQAHHCAAFSSDLEDPNLRFHNAVAILKFTSAASISKVVFSGNKGEVITGGSNGDLKITYSGGAISATPASTGGTSVTVTTAGQESDFYIAILPVNFSEGIIVRGYDDSGYLLCERKTSGELNTVNAAGLPIIANLGSIQDWLDNPKPTAVDLGLSVKWASFNLGASTPEGSGDYFSWGETAPKSSYTWSTYAYGQSKTGPFSEYVVDAASGTPDYKTILDLDDDAAHAIWGDAWRMPSKEEVQELRNNCTWTWTTMNGVAGYKVTSKKSGYTGNFIFLPAAGMMSGSKVQYFGEEGDYWSSSLYTAESCSSWSPYFTVSEFSTGDCYRYFGLPVRAVYGEVVPVAEITLSSTSMELLIGQTGQLTATILPDNATYKGLIWTSSDESIATVDANGVVTSISTGLATISVYSADGVITSTCLVSVNTLAQSISLDKTELELFVGDNPVILTATIFPSDNTFKNITWTSSNTSVAIVNTDGMVTAVAKGEAIITAATNDGSGLSATCFVSVSRHAELSTLSEQNLYCCQATINGAITICGITEIDKTDISVGFVFGTSQDLDAEGTTVASVLNDNGSFSYHLSRLKPNTKYYYKTTAIVDNKDYSGDVHHFTTYGSPIGVDMGCFVTLEDGSQHNVLWAEWNVDASKPEEYGGYYSWGETEPKSDYSWSTYKWCNGDYKKLTKYCTSGMSDYWDGYDSPDNKIVLDPDDDVAHVRWGGNWRMPADVEWIALKQACSWTWTSSDGINGLELTSKSTGNTLFFPAGGEYYCNSNSGNTTKLGSLGSRGYYWSSSLHSDYASRAWSEELYSYTMNTHYYNLVRSRGLSVRPIYSEVINVSGMSLREHNLTLTIGASFPLRLSIIPEIATDRSAQWVSSDESVATVNADGFILAHNAGITTITATTVDGGYSDSCHITVLPGDILLVETWEGETTTATPAHYNQAGTIVYGGYPVVYTNQSTNTKISISNYMNGQAYLSIYKDGGSWSIKGIPTGNAKEALLSYKVSNSYGKSHIVPSSTTATIGEKTIGAESAQPFTVSYVITLPQVSTFDLTLTNDYSGSIGIDDIEVRVIQ